MILTLTVVSLNGAPLEPAPSAVFDDNGGTIGRADHNTLVLPDPERFISRLQAEVVANGSSFLLRNVGSANSVLIDNQPLHAGQAAKLQPGNELRIGAYLLRAALPQAPAELPDLTLPGAQAHAPKPAVAAPLTAPQPAPAPLPRQAAPTPGLSEANPFAELLGTAKAPAGDPFADLFGSPAAPAAKAAGAAEMLPGPAGIDPLSASIRPAAPAAAMPLLPDDFDPFAAPPAPRPAAPAAAADPFADLLPPAPAPGIDQAFGLPAGSSEDPLAQFLASPAPLGKAAGTDALCTVSPDPLAMFAAPAPPAPAAQPAQPDQLPAMNAAFTPPRLQAPAQPPAAAPVLAPAAPPTVHSPTAGAPAAAEEALWQAFCEGAGIQLALPPGGAAERMQAIGMMMRAAIEGTLQLMAVRASTKHELHAAVTMIQQRNNNPLKFSPDAASGLEQLVQPPARGFLDGPAALEEAMHDLVGHSIGSVAGLRAALEGLLDRFDPAALEEKLTGASVLDSLLPMNRRARLWDLYLQHHETIREEAQEDFHRLFGKAFLAAYEQQVERLRQEKRGR